MSCGDHTSKLCVKLPPFNYANMTEHTQILRKKCTVIQQAKPLNKYLIKLKKNIIINNHHQYWLTQTLSFSGLNKKLTLKGKKKKTVLFL